MAAKQKDNDTRTNAQSPGLESRRKLIGKLSRPLEADYKCGFDGWPSEEINCPKCLSDSPFHELDAESKIKIVVCVDGGVVYGVYSNQPYDNVDVLLVDQDDLESEGIGRDEREAISDRETRSLMEHFVERPAIAKAEGSA
jgi:transcription elongation factor Elf1